LKEHLVAVLVGSVVLFEGGSCFGQKPKERATLTGHTKGVTSVAFSPNGELLASGSADDTVNLWDVATGKARATLYGHTETVYSVAFSPDNRIVASASLDNTIKLWDVAAAAFLFNAIRVPQNVQNVQLANMDLKRLQAAIHAYWEKTATFPAPLEKLCEKRPDGGPALVEKSGLVDPWGNPYSFEFAQNGRVSIYSDGPPGENKRISVWLRLSQMKKASGVGSLLKITLGAVSVVGRGDIGWIRCPSLALGEKARG
jgi:WD domain, G-beta repeat/Type II secretion system (T2SS), protein G